MSKSANKIETPFSRALACLKAPMPDNVQSESLVMIERAVQSVSLGADPGVYTAALAEVLGLTPAERVCCSKCGSLNVQTTIWQNPNTGEPGDEFGSWNAGDNTFCADCDIEGRDCNADLVADHEKERFAKLRARRKRLDARLAEEGGQS